MLVLLRQFLFSRMCWSIKCLFFLFQIWSERIWFSGFLLHPSWNWCTMCDGTSFLLIVYTCPECVPGCWLRRELQGVGWIHLSLFHFPWLVHRLWPRLVKCVVKARQIIILTEWWPYCFYQLVDFHYNIYIKRNSAYAVGFCQFTESSCVRLMQRSAPLQHYCSSHW